MAVAGQVLANHYLLCLSVNCGFLLLSFIYSQSDGKISRLRAVNWVLGWALPLCSFWVVSALLGWLLPCEMMVWVWYSGLSVLGPSFLGTQEIEGCTAVVPHPDYLLESSGGTLKKYRYLGFKSDTIKFRILGVGL